MKYTLLMLATIIILAACNHKSSQTGNSNTPVDGCYSFFNDKDSVYLKLETAGQQVNGKLVYQFFAKDKNTGSLKGAMKGDTLWAQYTFMSEGKESRRSVVFLRKQDNFIEGYGKLNDSTGEPDFSDRAALHFESKMILKKVDCAGVKSL